jgi:hypothetical protein
MNFPANDYTNIYFYFPQNASFFNIKPFLKNIVGQCCREFSEIQFKKKKKLNALY